MKNKDLLDMEDSFADRSENLTSNLTDEIEKLRRENLELRKTLEEHGIVEFSIINDVEYICSAGILQLKKIVDTSGLTSDDTKTLDLLHKNLKIARGKIDTKDVNQKAKSIDDLLRIVSKNG